MFKVNILYVTRYAFTPLLDAPEDGDDEEEEYFVSDAYGEILSNGLTNSLL